MSNDKLKRKWYYITHPGNFGLECTKPNCKNKSNIYWSEFESHIWCYECEEDIYYEPGVEIFTVKTALLLGITFDRIDLENNKYLKYDIETGNYISLSFDEIQK